MTRAGERSPVVVIGVGNTWRTDDGIGAAAVALLHDRCDGSDVDLVVVDGEPTRLIDAWRGRQLALVIDAVVRGSRPGTIHRAELGVDELPGPSAGASSHAGGVAEAIALARVLDRTPRRLVVLGVEPACLAPGSGLSTPVAEAVPALVEQVIVEIGTAGAHSQNPRRGTLAPWRKGVGGRRSKYEPRTRYRP